MTTNRHEIDPVFAETLEHELHSSLRRTRRWAQAEPEPAQELAALRTSAWAWLRLAAVAALAISLGAFGSYAAIRYDDGAEKELIIARVEVMLDLERARLVLEVESLGEVEALVAHGVVSTAEIEQRRLELDMAEHAVQRLELDLAEVRVSGREPDDRLSAPLVDGNDFVAERLKLELAGARAHRQRAASELDRARKYLEAAVATEREHDEARLDLLTAVRRVTELEKKLVLRRDFLAGKYTAFVVEHFAILAQVQPRRLLASEQLELARREMERIEKLVDAGRMSTRALREARLQMHEWEAELQLADLEMQLIDKRLESAGKDKNDAENND